MLKQVIAISILLPNLVFTEPSKSEWAKDAIWYQIFPERYNNGDPSNDPTAESLMGVWPWEYQTDWQISPWTSDWYEFQPWEIANGQPFKYQFQIRRYGGDIQGIINKLDYLDNLGVTAIYLNPVFQSPSSHKYGAESYHHIDRFFGPDPVGDQEIVAMEDPLDPATWQWTAADKLFLQLIQEVHARDMHIIIDGVFNHVGLTFWAFQDVIENREASPYYNWFNIKGSSGRDESHLNEFQTLPPFFLQPGADSLEYTGYVADLPAFRQDASGPIEPIRNHIKNIVQRWGDPNGDGDPTDGIDGWRLDVAERVQIGFWRLFNGWVKELNPQAYLTGEVWWEDYWNNHQFNAAPWLADDIFDGVMNYRFTDAMYKFFIDENQQIQPTVLDSLLKSVEIDYGKDKIYHLQNLLGSHDSERIASAVANPDRWLDHGNNLYYNRDFDIGSPTQPEWDKLKSIVTFQFTYPGTPYIYYGDETGMWGADDPDCRKPMLWSEFDFDDEIAHPCDRIDDCSYQRKRDPVTVNKDIFDTYQTLIKFRHDLPALTNGSYKTVLADDESGLFAYQRQDEHQIILAIFNSQNQEQKIPRFLLKKHSWNLIFSSTEKTPGKRNIPPNSAKIFKASL